MILGVKQGGTNNSIRLKTYSLSQLAVRCATRVDRLSNDQILLVQLQAGLNDYIHFLRVGQTPWVIYLDIDILSSFVFQISICCMIQIAETFVSMGHADDDLNPSDSLTSVLSRVLGSFDLQVEGHD